MNKDINILSISQAVQRITKDISSLAIEQISLENALDRILAQQIVAPIDVPDFDNSAMDGYALNCDHVFIDQQIPIIGHSYAGHPFDGIVNNNECVRITTGAPIPNGCNTVIMQENIDLNNNAIMIKQIPKLQEHIRPRGNDMSQGQIIFEAGLKLTAKELPVIASLGMAHVFVYRRPRVAFFSTGDELRECGTKLQVGQIYESNRYCIAALIQKMNCEPIYLGCLTDDKITIQNAFKQAAQDADLIITSGGVSVGDADYVKQVLQELGHVDFWKIAIKPGKPFAYGSINDVKFCGLPGNPVSAMVTFYLFVQPLLAKMSGHTQWQPPMQMQARATTLFKKVVSRTEYQRGIYSVNQQGSIEVKSVNNQSSGAFHASCAANCFIILPPSDKEWQIGDLVTIEPFNHLLS